MERIKQALSDYLTDRKTMKENNSDPTRVFELFMGEIAELNEAIITGHLIGPEMADVAIFLLNMASNFDIDLESEIWTKIARNHLKFEAKDFQEGDYYESMLKSRKKWIGMGGDNEFYK